MSLTPGQLHFYLERRRLFLDHIADDDIAGDLAELIVQRFIYEPYHVKLAILHAATFLRRASPEKLQALIEAIQDIDANRESLFISTAIVDALKFLGGLEDSAEGARDGIRAQFAAATGVAEEEAVINLALTLSVAMFDHPYDVIYYEEMEALPEEKRRLLLRRAARGPETRKSMSLSWILRKVASFGDPADAAIMQEFSKLPDAQNSFPQEEWDAFVLAIRFLGRHRLPLLPLTGGTEGEHALIAIRDLVYAAETGDSGLSTLAWSRLDTLPLSRVMGCLSEVESALCEVHWNERDIGPRLSLAIAFADQLCGVARRFLESGDEAVYFRAAHGRGAGAELAFGVIESFGDRGDIALLKRLAQEPRHAQRALSALRKLDS